MNVSQLRTFLTVVEHGSFSAAARALNVSQPAVTMQIQSLESDLGATLLDRRQRGVRLTEAGQELRPIAQRVLDELEDARARIEALEDRVTGRLLLAASTTPGQYVLPGIIGAFLAQYPEVSAALTIGDSAQVVDAVESEHAALGVVGAQLKGARVEYERIGSDDLVIIGPPNDPIATGDPVTIESVAEAPIIMRELGSGTRLVTEQMFRAASIEPGDLPVVMELGSSEAVVNAVEGGMGIGVVSRLVAEKAISLGTVAVVPLRRPEMSRPLFAVIGRGTPTRAARAFLDMLRDRMEDATRLETPAGGA